MNKKMPNEWETTDLMEIFTFHKKTDRRAGEGKSLGKYKFFTSSEKQTKYIDSFDLEGEYLIFSTGGHAGLHYCNEKFSVSADCFIVSVSEKILAKYVYYYLCKNIHLLEKGFKGAGLKHISKNYIQKIKIFFPKSKETQKKIVSRLEKLEKAKEWRKKADELTEDLLKSIFNEMFGEISKFKIKKIGEICSTQSGGTPLRSIKEYWENGKIPWIRSGDVNKDKITKVDGFITEAGLKNSSAKYIEPETVLIAMYGATAGKTSISKIRATTNQAVCSIVPKNNSLEQRYLLYWLKSKYKKIVSLSFGAGQPNLSQEIIRSLEIPVPDIELQNKFASIVKEIEAMKEHQKRSKNQINNLFNALMQKAFKGEIA